VPDVCKPYLNGSSLVALQKKPSGLRPIAIGECQENRYGARQRMRAAKGEKRKGGHRTARRGRYLMRKAADASGER
jgi:hypothetical protein